MSFLSFFKKEEEVSLLIDIGSGTITVALASFSKKVPEFLYCTKGSFPKTDRLLSSKLTTSMGTLLDSTLASVISEGLNNKKITRVVVSFASPWYIFKSKEVHLAENKPFVVTKSFLEDLSIKEEKLFKKELSSESSTEEKSGWSVIEKSIVHTKINGYILNESLGKKTSSFDAFMYMSAIAKNVEEKVLNKILKHTHLSKNKVLMHTFPLISFLTIRENFAETSDFLLVDVAGEVTDISSSKGDIISQNTSIPLGRNFIIRQIAKYSKTSNEIAESTLQMYLSKKTDEHLSTLIQKILLDIEKEWFIYFQDMLHSLFPKGNYPNKIFLIVDSDVSPIFLEYLKSFKMETVLVNEEILKDLYTTLPNVKPDQFIIILADFYNNLRQGQ